MSLAVFQDKLEALSGRKFQLRINDNRSTMLSVKWERSCIKVSLHWIFLQAPHEIIDLLIQYLIRQHKRIAPEVKAYISDCLRQLDYSHLVDKEKLDTDGQVYDLQELYDEVNNTYFKGKVDLNITWHGPRRQRSKSRITFGLFHDQLKLIKISRFLDDEAVPEYVVRFVIYHEMLHYICPPYVDENGIERIHNKEFCRREKKFREYELAEQWIEEYRNNRFTPKKRQFYGWAQ